MTTSPFAAALDRLTDVQRQAVDWDREALLVLAGPGSGKTQVLTCRIARLLDASRGRNFRILSLTFTNKAADEMKSRVAALVPGLEDRTTIGTFHSFCAQILRQHGVHIDIRPDFTIYSADEDRRALLEDALRRAARAGHPVALEDARLLPLIDRLKSRLVEPAGVAAALPYLREREQLARVYQLYDAELRALNALDFNALIQDAYRLVTAFPAIAVRYQRTYPYWLLDEFQDTNSAQYQLIRTLAAPDFRNVFVVADDDQIIYEWNGANYRQIQAFLADFDASLIQLPTNYRCPPVIVEAANRLVAYNAARTASKAPLRAGRGDLRFPAGKQVDLRVFATDEDEASGIAEEIAGLDRGDWGHTAVLARTRVLLERMDAALKTVNVPSVVAQRRDEFLSPQCRWLFATLRQMVRPLDHRNALIVVEAFNRFAGLDVDAEQIVADGDATGRSYLGAWCDAVKEAGVGGTAGKVLELIDPCVGNPQPTEGVVERILEEFSAQVTEAGDPSDLAEDIAAWRQLTRDIRRHLGTNAPLDQVVQEMQLRSKAPLPDPEAVTLMTIHAAKGTEFDFVFVVGMAEEVIPSYQSLKKGDQSPEMEEERRNCFVAVTRTRERLVLSRAERYKGWAKSRSRFLDEMGLMGSPGGE